MKRPYEFFYILGMNTNYLIVLIIPAEYRTSTDPFCNWHVENEVVFVHIDLAVVFCELF